MGHILNKCPVALVSLSFIGHSVGVIAAAFAFCSSNRFSFIAWSYLLRVVSFITMIGANVLLGYDL